MSRSSSSTSSDVDEGFVPCEQPGVKNEGDEAEYSLQPYLFEPTRKLPSSDESSNGENESEDEGDSGSSSDENRLNNLEW